VTAIADEKRAVMLFVRPDGKEKVTGVGQYTADMNVTGQLHARFRYADFTHARVLRVDASKARALPGVLAVLTHEDVPDVRYGGGPVMVKDRRLFAKEKVRFEGDIVAGVAALTPEIAEQAAALIEVEYEPLPAVSDIEAALADDAPLIHDQWESYEASAGLGRDRNRVAYATVVKGDADEAMAGADVVVKGRYVADASHGAPIEPRAIIAQWQGDRVTVWSSTQVPFAARAGVAEVLQIPQSNVRVIVPLLGGGFGAKCDFHFEGHVAALARAARRPVKLVFSRREEFVAVDHRREGMVIELETGARKDGTLVARRGRVILDKGAFCGEGGFFAQMAAMLACGPYVIENVNVESSSVYFPLK
jgi:CO/xanthine dehydrogenase Mo-binding subunit